MTSVTIRPYKDASDLDAMIEIIRARARERVDDFPGIEDLQMWTADPDPARQITLWQQKSDEIVGYTIVDTSYHSVWFEVKDGFADADLEKQMLAWGEKWIQDARAASQQDRITTTQVEPLTVRVSCRDDFFERVFLLEQSGFTADTEYTVHLERSLSEPIADPVLPSGYSIRHVEGEHEVDALVVLHRAAFGTENMTAEGRRSWMLAPDYDPELDLVVVAPDGSLAAYCFAHISHADNELTGQKVGWTDPVACHPDHQRKGLARALLLRGIALLRDRGMERAALGTWSENEAMWNAAESVGFEVSAKTIFYYKELANGQ
ncbi:GNAT family N-acetyltransferase [Chloroflexi bacterium TSY]|nr:GNAT family N-acetyltransferase [Chloroflexi bacterium TSY]